VIPNAELVVVFTGSAWEVSPLGVLITYDDLTEDYILKAFDGPSMT
jgi:hypothetical protein